MRRSGILCLTLSAGVLFFGGGAQAQSFKTRHVREAVSNGGSESHWTACLGSDHES